MVEALRHSAIAMLYGAAGLAESTHRFSTRVDTPHDCGGSNRCLGGVDGDEIDLLWIGIFQVIYLI